MDIVGLAPVCFERDRIKMYFINKHLVSNEFSPMSQLCPNAQAVDFNQRILRPRRAPIY